jgi:hypothetical protein
MRLELKLRKINRETTPSRQFQRTLWVKLDQRWHCAYPTMVISWRRLVAIPVASLCLVVVMGTGTYAYASPNVADGDVLYPVKRSLESVESRFHRSEISRAQFERRMIRRRIQEGEILRNKLERIRVKIDESDLPAQEKEAILMQLDLKIDRLEDSVHN